MLKEFYIKYYKNQSIVIKLISINATVFLATYLTSIIIKSSNGTPDTFLHFLSGTANLKEMTLKPWTIFTYMFMHSLENARHIFWNMIILYLFGRYFLQFFGAKRLLQTYILGGIFGYLFFALLFNIFPAYNAENSAIIGASAAVYAIAIGVVTYSQKIEIRVLGNFSIRLIYIALFFFLTDFFTLNSRIGVDGGNEGGTFAHIGGALFGFLTFYYLKRGKNFFRLFSDSKKWFKRRPKIKVEYSAQKNERMTDEEYNSMKVNRQAIIDQILDKIKESGYDSLTKKEKEILFQESKKI